MVDAEYTNCAYHRKSLEDPEQPLSAEGIAIQPLGEFANTIDAADLQFVREREQGLEEREGSP